MYYLHKKSKNATMPSFDYTFKNFKEFYELCNVLEATLFGTCYILIKTDEYKDIINFIEHSESYVNVVVYIEVNESLLKYISLNKPDAYFLDSKSNFEVFKELVSKYNILFKEDCLKKLYFAIEHTYDNMESALLEIKSEFPNTQIITEYEIEKLFVIDSLTYPKSVLIAYLRLDRGRKIKLDRCVETFGNDLVYYSMRKNLRILRTAKLKYLQTGEGSYLIKTISQNNIIRMSLCLEYNNLRFREVYTILNMYEQGITCLDILENERSK